MDPPEARRRRRRRALRAPHCVASGNPLNEREAAVFGLQVLAEWGWDDQPVLQAPRLASFEWTVSDVCRLCIARIVNRPSWAPVVADGKITYACGGSERPELLRRIAALWERDDPAPALEEWLAVDFATRGSGTTELQAGAALRLADHWPAWGERVARRIAEVAQRREAAIDFDLYLSVVGRSRSADVLRALERAPDRRDPADLDAAGDR